MLCVYCRIPLIAWAVSFGSLCYVAMAPCIESKGRERRLAAADKEERITERARLEKATDFVSRRGVRLGVYSNKEVTEVTYQEVRKRNVVIEVTSGYETVRIETESCCVCSISRRQIKSVTY